MAKDDVIQVVSAMVCTLYPLMNEPDRRLFLGTAALVLGRGGDTLVSSLTGASISTITAGAKEIITGHTADVLWQYWRNALKADLADMDAALGYTDWTGKPDRSASHAGTSAPVQRTRKPGAGRKSALEKYPELPGQLEQLLLRAAGQDPDGFHPLRYTVLRLQDLSDQLSADPEHPIAASTATISKVLEEMGYQNWNSRKQALAKALCPDRAAQFHHIGCTAAAFLDAGDPVLSIGVLPQEDVSRPARPSRDTRAQGDAVSPTLSPELQSAGQRYQLETVSGSVQGARFCSDRPSIGFLSAAVKVWLTHIGLPTFPAAKRLYLVLETGIPEGMAWGSMGDALQKMADLLGWEIQVSLCPPGISRWTHTAHTFSFVLPDRVPGGFTTLSLRLVGSGLAVQSQKDQSLWPAEDPAPPRRRGGRRGLLPQTTWAPMDWNETFSPRPKGGQPG